MMCAAKKKTKLEVSDLLQRFEQAGGEAMTA